MNMTALFVCRIQVVLCTFSDKIGIEPLLGLSTGGKNEKKKTSEPHYNHGITYLKDTSMNTTLLTFIDQLFA